MSTLLQDLRYAVRTLRRTPGFTLVAATTLALGIGANTAIFSVFYGVLVRPLSYPDPDRLVQLAQTSSSYRGQMGITYREFRFLEERSEVFSAVAATTPVGFNIFTGSEALRVAGLRVSRGYFDVLGVQPALGRGFLPEEDLPGGATAVVLSHGLWQRHFGGDPAILGRTVSLDGAPHIVVGIMPPGFQSEPAVDAWSTMAQVSRTIGSGQNLVLIGRLRPGLSLDQARQRMTGTFTAFLQEFSQRGSNDVGVDLLPYQQLIVSDVSRPIRVLLGAIGFVLLIACANVASLLLSRGITRARELAMRMALGAGRGVLVRQLLTESLVLALIGGVIGLVVAVWGLQALIGFLPGDVPRTEGIRLDGRALGFTFGLSLLTGLIFGLLPAWQIARVDLQNVLKDGSGRTTAGSGHGRMRDALVIAEIALSLVLLTGAGLLGRTFANLMKTNPGFDVERVLSAEIWLTGSRYERESSPVLFYDELTRRLRAERGVEAAAVVEAGLPLTRGGNQTVVIEGEGRPRSIDYRTITPGYFGVLGVSVLEGRDLAASDGETAERVAVVNQTLARRFLSDRGALGRNLDVGGDGGVTYRVVGVVADVRSYIGFPAPPTVFVTSAQTPPDVTRVFSSWFPIHVLLRTSGDPAALGPALARAIHETDALVPIGQVRPMTEILATSVAFQRFLLFLLGGFAALAVLLATVGIYGLMSHRVVQRRHEFGIRMSLGAVPRDVLELVLGRGLRLTAVGVGLGLVGAAGLTRLLANQLYGVAPLDLTTFISVALGVALVSLGACYLPARRATQVDPMIALRAD
jgi:putative ABC transport system permease protein